MSITISRSYKYVDFNVSAPNNRGYLTIDTSSWIDYPWMFYELPALKFEIYTESDGEVIKYKNFVREIRTYNPVYSPLGVLNVTIDIRNVPEEFILRITPIFDNDAIAARNMLIENGIENGDIWGSDQDVPTQSFDLNLEFIECSGEYVPPTPPVPPTHEETITGVPPITFDGSTGEPIVSWTILGNGEQTGTPSPDNIIMPEFVGVRTGNLFDFATAYSEYIVDGKIQTSAYNLNRKYNYASAEMLGNSYVISISASSVKSNDVYIEKSENGEIAMSQRIIKGNSGTISLIFTPTSISDWWRISYSGGNATNTIDDIMLNRGSTALQYEPFGYKIPISCAGQTTPVYLWQTQTVRRIKKLVLTGEETDWRASLPLMNHTIGARADVIVLSALCNIAVFDSTPSQNVGSFDIVYSSLNAVVRFNASGIATTVDDFKQFLRDEYANGTPVTVWYVLASPETGIVNEPLMKIGDYSDELHSEDAGVTIPTTEGQNTLTVDTTIQPSEMTITYIKEEQ